MLQESVAQRAETWHDSCIMQGLCQKDEIGVQEKNERLVRIYT